MKPSPGFPRVTPAAVAGSLRRTAVLALLLGLGSAPMMPLRAQVPAGPVRGFVVPVADRATGKRRALLRGDARPLSRDDWEVEGMWLAHFAADGTTNLIVTTDRCTYHVPDQSIASPGRLHLVAASGRLTLDGVGFAWNEADGLVISNQVTGVLEKTILEKSAAGVPAGGNPTAGASEDARGALQIDATEFRYLGALARFRHEVRVRDQEGSIRCDQLDLHLAAAEGPGTSSPGLSRLETVEAEGHVRIDSPSLRAASGHAVYWMQEEQLELTEDPVWKLGSREGRANRLRLYRASSRLRAEGQVRLQLPGGSAVPVFALGPGTVSAAPGSTNPPPPMEVRAARFDLEPERTRTNVYVATFREEVEVSSDKGRLRCETLTGLFQKTEAAVRAGEPAGGATFVPLSAMADGGVDLRQGSNHVAGSRAEFRAAGQTIDLDGPVSWQSGDREGSSDTLHVNGEERSFLARGAVRMRLKARSIGSPAWLLPRDSAAGPGDPAQNRSEPARDEPPVEVSCGEFEYRAARDGQALGQAIYRGGVTVVGSPGTSMSCETLTAAIDPMTQAVRRLVADERVELRTTEGDSERTAHGDRAVYDSERKEIRLTGGRGVEVIFKDPEGVSRAMGRTAVYDGERDLLELDGQPTVQSVKGSLSGDVARLDRANSILSARGMWKIRVPVRALGDLPTAKEMAP